MLPFFTTILLAFAIIGTPAASPDISQSPYAAEFEQARSETTNPLQLEILADDVITAEEYERSIQAFLGCMHDAGYEVITERDQLMPAIYQFVWNYPDATSGAEVPQSIWGEYDQQFDDCSFEWALPVQTLYASVVYFPNNEDVFDANLACLQADELVPDDFDRDDIERAATTGDWGDDVDPFTPEFTLCLVNPFKIGFEPSASTPVAKSPYAAEFEVARNATENELQLQVLEDDVITAEEYDQVVTAFLACMNEQGYIVTLEPDPLNPALPYFVWTPTPETPTAISDDVWNAYDDVFDDCSREWKTEVEVLYGSIIANPENNPWDEMYYQCLTTRAVLPEDFTLEDYAEAEATGVWPEGVNIFSDEFAVCIGNPSNPVDLPIATP